MYWDFQLSSAHHYPVINISPRVCKAAIPLYAAFNQCGAGHYDAVVFKNKVLKLHATKSTPDMRCTCGRGSSQQEHCGVFNTNTPHPFTVPVIYLVVDAHHSASAVTVPIHMGIYPQTSKGEEKTCMEWPTQ